MALTDRNMPGFGDLPGDSSNPNSPDYREPAFGMDDAAALVASQLEKADEVGELVSDVANAAALLQWIGSNVVVPHHLHGSWSMLDRHAKLLSRKVEREYAVLNGGVA